MPESDALSVHVVFFDVDRDGQITRSETKQALQELGFSPFVSAVVAPILTLALPGDAADARALRHDDSGALSSDGSFDEEAFQGWFDRTDRDHSGTLSRLELLRSSASLADDAVSLVASVGEFQLLYVLLSEDGGLTREAVHRFLNGDLFRELIQRRADGEDGA